jgi:hypothetical protein
VEQVRKTRVVADSDATVRRNLTEDERRAKTLKPDADGMLRNARGELANDGRTEFIADAESGDLVTFTAGAARTGRTVIDADGNSHAQEERVHHSSAAGGQDVEMAGSIRVREGQVERVSNISGHYKPKIAEMLQFLEGLLRKGLLLDKEWLDAADQPLTGQAQQLYETAVDVQQKLREKAIRGDNIDDDLALIEKARQMLTKLGCAPSNKINPDAKVEFLDVQEGMTGREIKDAATAAADNAVPVKDFLQGGNNQAQRKAKENVLAEMKGNAKFQENQREADRAAPKATPKPTADVAKQAMEKNLRACEKLLAERPDLRASEINELKLTVSRLRKQIAEAAAPTDDDLKDMLRAVLDLKSRLGMQPAPAVLEGEDFSGVTPEELRAIKDGTMGKDRAQKILLRGGMGCDAYDALSAIASGR